MPYVISVDITRKSIKQPARGWTDQFVQNSNQQPH